MQASFINTIEYNAEKYWGRQVLDGTFELPKINTDIYGNSQRYVTNSPSSTKERTAINCYYDRITHSGIKKAKKKNSFRSRRIDHQ